MALTMINHLPDYSHTFLGIDLGTTGLKAILVAEDGHICGCGYREYKIQIPETGYAEQNPCDWWKALKEALADALHSSQINIDSIAGIGLSGQMHGLVALDSDMSLLYPAIIWCDQRSAKQSTDIRQKIGNNKLGSLVQNPVSTGFQVCSLLWLRENMPFIYERIRHVLLPKDYLRFLLTNELGTEPSDACSTLMFDNNRRNWSIDMLNTLDIDRSILPDVFNSPVDIHAGLSLKAAADLGLKPGIPVVFGGGDQPMQAIGNGILHPGTASVTLGTGGQIFVPVLKPVFDEQLRTHTFCHANSDTWYIMGAILNCCLAQNWFFDKILGTHDFNRMHQAASEVAPGCNGLYFLPYLTGERTPHMNPHAKGIFFGLTLEHNQNHMARAVIEGISYAIVDAMHCIQALDPCIDRIILSGGGARSILWKQMIADMLERPIYTTHTTEEAGLGAAICAMVGTKTYNDLDEACDAIIHYDDNCVEPNPTNSSIYRDNYSFFRDLYKANCSLFK